MLSFVDLQPLPQLGPSAPHLPPLDRHAERPLLIHQGHQALAAGVPWLVPLLGFAQVPPRIDVELSR